MPCPLCWWDEGRSQRGPSTAHHRSCRREAACWLRPVRWRPARPAAAGSALRWVARTPAVIHQRLFVPVRDRVGGPVRKRLRVLSIVDVRAKPIEVGVRRPEPTISGRVRAAGPAPYPAPVRPRCPSGPTTRPEGLECQLQA